MVNFEDVKNVTTEEYFKEYTFSTDQEKDKLIKDQLIGILKSLTLENRMGEQFQVMKAAIDKADRSSINVHPEIWKAVDNQLLRGSKMQKLWWILCSNS